MQKFIRTSESVTRVVSIDTKAAIKLKTSTSSGYGNSDVFKQEDSPTWGPQEWDNLPKIKWPE